jgi:uncharacterized protein YjbI with pentapeptide repeats
MSEGIDDPPSQFSLCAVWLHEGISGVDRWNIARRRGATVPSLERSELIDRDLQGANFAAMNLVQAQLAGANLEYANLNGADLTGADLERAKCENASLRRANLSAANLTGSNLQNALLQGASLQAANLQDANVSEANLQAANLCGANLSGANLQGTNLRGANLDGATFHRHRKSAATDDRCIRKGKASGSVRAADFRMAVLDGVSFNGFDLEGTNLQGASLRNADFTGAYSMLAGQIAGADITNAKLPSEIAGMQSLRPAEEAAKNSRSIFYVMLIGCMYSTLTVLSTSDFQLLTNSATAPLPVVSANVPILWFFYAAPLLLLFALTYFHLYLRQLWVALSRLPAVFPDGRPLDEQAYPWLMSGLVRRYVKRLQKRSFVAMWQEWVSLFLGWWTVPLTLIGVWWRFLDRQEPMESQWIALCATISVGVSLCFLKLTREFFESNGVQPTRLDRSGEDRFPPSLVLSFQLWLVRWRGETALGISAATFLFAASWCSRGTNWLTVTLPFDVSGRPENSYTLSPAQLSAAVKGANFYGRNLRGVLGGSSFMMNSNFEHSVLQKAELSGSNLSHANLQHKSAGYAKLERAKLDSASLQGADLQSSSLFRANLENANLQGASLQSASLEGANLYHATLQGANLRWAHAQYANFRGASLHSADLRYANFVGANFRGANLENVKIDGASLRDAILDGAELRGTDFAHTELSGASLQKAVLESRNLRQANLERANLESSILQSAVLVDARLEGCILQKANLQGANLQGANLQGANLQGANLLRAYLRGAKLQGSNLRGADLRGADLEGADLQGALYNAATVLPGSEFDPKSLGMVESDPTSHR